MFSVPLQPAATAPRPVETVSSESLRRRRYREPAAKIHNRNPVRCFPGPAGDAGHVVDVGVFGCFTVFPQRSPAGTDGSDERTCSAAATSPGETFRKRGEKRPSEKRYRAQDEGTVSDAKACARQRV